MDRIPGRVDNRHIDIYIYFISIIYIYYKISVENRISWKHEKFT
jgi:hypothetical protein